MQVDAGARLKRRREQLGLTQHQVGLRMATEARRLGRGIAPPAKSTISCWETGRRKPIAFYALLLCRILDAGPEQLGLEMVLTPDRLAELNQQTNARATSGAPAPMAVSRAGTALLHPGADTPGIDWERLGSALLSMRRVDGRVVEDQRALTDQYVEGLISLTTATHLDLITEHLGRLRRLRAMTDDHHFRQELGLLICHSAVLAGVSWTSQTDYGLAMEAYRYCAEMAADLNEPSFRASGLAMQAQLYGGTLHRRLPNVGRQRRLLEEAETMDKACSAAARLLVHSTSAMLESEFGAESEARRATELAYRAESELPSNGRLFSFISQLAGPTAASTEHTSSKGLATGYSKITQAAVESRFGRPDKGIDLLSEVIARCSPTEFGRGQMARLHLQFGTAYGQTGAVELAASHTSEALRLARGHETPFLVRATEAFGEGLVATAPNHYAVQALQEELDRTA